MRGSKARQTSLIPPAPRRETISYGPSFVPASTDMDGVILAASSTNGNGVTPLTQPLARRTEYAQRHELHGLAAQTGGETRSGDRKSLGLRRREPGHGRATEGTALEGRHSHLSAPAVAPPRHRGLDRGVRHARVRAGAQASLNVERRRNSAQIVERRPLRPPTLRGNRRPKRPPLHSRHFNQTGRCNEPGSSPARN